MKTLVASLILASVPMGGSFGEAEAITISVGDASMIVELKVEVPEETHAVIVHLGLEGQNMRFPMVPRSTPGLWGVRTEVEVKNWQVVFEIVGPVPEVSQPMTLGFLGATLHPEPDPEEPPDDDLSRETRQWGYLGLAFAAASLSLLAFWVLGGKDKEPDAGEEE